jgi:ribosomal protein S18 acetylase RimI-like enzyme
MTVTDAPEVRLISPDVIGLIVDKLNSWCDDMPEINLDKYNPASLQVFAVPPNGVVVGGYVMVAIPMAHEIIALAIDPEYRRRGFGRMCCMDALFRSAKRPLVLTANDASVDFAKAVGFKLIGKRKQPDGTVLTRLGWHAPRPKTDPHAPAGC